MKILAADDDAVALRMSQAALTARTGTENLVEGFTAGADDYVTKPFRADELRARVDVGMRLASLQRSVADRFAALEAAERRYRELGALRAGRAPAVLDDPHQRRDQRGDAPARHGRRAVSARVDAVAGRGAAAGAAVVPWLSREQSARAGGDGVARIAPRLRAPSAACASTACCVRATTV